MKNKAFLPLLEQLCMILIFAIAAAFCLQGFATAARLSEWQEKKDHAVLVAQNAAETLKHTAGDFQAAADVYGGTYEDAVWQILYDTDWHCTSNAENTAYVLQAVKAESDDAMLGIAEISVRQENELLFTLTVGWQEAEA